MGKCTNCHKSLSFFRRSKKCSICNNKFCDECFIVNEKNLEIYSNKGHCWKCFIEKNPNNITGPEISNPNLPTANQYQAFIKANISPIIRNPMNTFTKLEILGRGTSAVVTKVIDKETQKLFALKEISSESQTPQETFQEFAMSALSPCKNIVTCHALYKYGNNRFAMLLELMSMTLGKLNTKLINREEVMISYIIREITQGIQFIHNGCNIHRDLKSENIFIDSAGNVKIGDFGLSVQLTRERDTRTTFVGSPYWIAPEILNGRNYNELCDIWSLGIVCFELAEGFPPFFRAKTLLELTYRIHNDPEPQISEKWSPGFREFVACCLKKKPEERISAVDLLKKPFLMNVNEEAAKKLILEYANSN